MPHTNLQRLHFEIIIKCLTGLACLPKRKIKNQTPGSETGICDQRSIRHLRSPKAEGVGFTVEDAGCERRFTGADGDIKTQTHIRGSSFSKL